MSKFVPVGQEMVVKEPMRYDIVFMPQHPIQGMRGGHEFLAGVSGDDRVHQRVHCRILDTDHVVTAFLICRLRGPEISLLIPGRLRLRKHCHHHIKIERTQEALGDSKNYLVAESLIRVEFYDVEPVGIELPSSVDLVVKETAPGIKGATASAQVKPATLETGLVVQVPPFVNEGDKIRVNTETGEYQSRV